MTLATMSLAPCDWARPMKDHLEAPLRSSASSTPWINNDNSSSTSNVTFICAEGEKVSWNGLAYLAHLCGVFQARSGEEQNFTVLLPDYGAGVVRHFLRFISLGETQINNEDSASLELLMKDIGVSHTLFFAYI